MSSFFHTPFGALFTILVAGQIQAAEVGDRLQTTDKAVVCASAGSVPKARAKLNDSELLSALHCVHAEMGLHVIVLDPHAVSDDSVWEVSLKTLDGKTVTAYTDAPSVSAGDIYELLRKMNKGR